MDDAERSFKAERENTRRLQRELDEKQKLELEYPHLLEELRRKTVELEILKTYPDKIESIKENLEESNRIITEFIRNATLHVGNLKLLSDDFAKAKANIDSLTVEVKKANESTNRLHQKLDDYDKKSVGKDAVFEEKVGEVKLSEDTNSEKLDDLLKLIKKLADDLEKYAKKRILFAVGISREDVQSLLNAVPAADADAVWDELIVGHAIVGSTATALSAILADTNELQTDWVNGGRLDLILDSVLSASGVAAAYSSVNSGHGFRGTVTAAAAPKFTIGALAGIGVGAFADATFPWYAYVFRHGAVAAAPQGEFRKVTAYTSASGEFTADAYTAPGIGIGDDVIIYNPVLSSLYNFLSDTTYGLNALHTHLAAIPTTPTLQATWTDAKAAFVDASIQTVDTVVDAIKTETDQLPNWRFSVPYAFDAVVENKASAAEQTLTALSKTITYPTGATKVSAILACYLTAAAQAAGGHKIGVTIQYQKNGGGYADIKDYTAVPPLTIPDLDEAMGFFAVELDVSALIDTSGVQYDFLFQVDSDNAGSVNYVSNFVLIITYSM